MHICFIITRGDLIGGAQIHVRDTAAALIEDGHQATVLVGTKGDFTDQLDDRGVTWHHVPSLIRSIHPLKDLRAIGALRRLIRKIKPDLVSTHTAKAGMVGRLAAFTTGYEGLFTAHGWQFADGIPGKQAQAVLAIERVVSRMCRCIITVSRYDFDLAVRKKAAKADKMTVIHNGLPWRDEFARVYPGSQDHDGGDSRPVRLLMVARFQPQKDHETLFRALEGLKDRRWTLDLVGDGPDMAAAEARAAELGLSDRISFLGQRRDVPELLEKADLFLLITHWEGFPRSIVEAMRAGLPVVATDVGGCGESVRDGENGFLVRKNDALGLTDVLKGLLDDLPRFESLGKKGRKIYEEEFTFRAMYDKTVKVYRDITGLK